MNEKPDAFPDGNASTPKEYLYAAGWLLWTVAGGYFALRGFKEDRPIMLASGGAAIAVGIMEAAVIVLRPLWPWKRVVRVGWVMLFLIFFAIIVALDLMGHRVLP